MLDKVLKDVMIYAAAAVTCVAAFTHRDAIYEMLGYTPPSTYAAEQVEKEVPVDPVMPGAVEQISGGTVSIRKSADGHFWTQSRVNSGSVKFLVDTGASVVALTPEDAKRAGLRPRDLVYDVRINTANGETKGARVTLRNVAVGTVTLREVEAVVIEEGLSTSLLGMSYLGRLQKVEVSQQNLLLRL